MTGLAYSEAKTHIYSEMPLLGCFGPLAKEAIWHFSGCSGFEGHFSTSSSTTWVLFWLFWPVAYNVWETLFWHFGSLKMT